MEYAERNGRLFTGNGLDLGISYSRFEDMISQIDYDKIDSAESLVERAYYLNNWGNKAVEISAIAALWFTHSILIAIMAGCLTCFVETLAFYILGDSIRVSLLSKTWNYLRIPVYVGFVYAYTPGSILVWLFLLLLLFAEGLLGLFSTIILIPPKRIWYRFYGKSTGDYSSASVYINRPRMSIEMLLDQFSIRDSSHT